MKDEELSLIVELTLATGDASVLMAHLMACRNLLAQIHEDQCLSFPADEMIHKILSMEPCDP